MGKRGTGTRYPDAALVRKTRLTTRGEAVTHGAMLTYSMKTMGRLSFALLLSCAALAAPENDLFDAAWKGNIPAAQKALDAGADINARAKTEKNSYLTQPIIAASQHADIEMLRFLFSRGADANVQVFWGGNALAYLREAPRDSKRTEAFKWLVQNTNIDVNHLSKDGKNLGALYTEKGATDLLLCLKEHAAYRYGAEIQMEQIDAAMSFNDKQLRLLDAVKAGDLAGCKEWIAQGAQCSAPVNSTTGHPLLNAFLTACRCGQLDIARYFAEECGARVNDKAIHQQNSLMFAAQAPREKRLEMFTWLLENTDADPFYVNSDKKSVRDIALANAAGEIVALIDKKAEELAKSCPVTQEALKQQKKRVEHYKKALAKEDKQYQRLLNEKEDHGFEAKIWDEVSHDLGGLTDVNDNRRLNEHRKSRNADHRAAAVKNQRVTNLKQAYERETVKYRKMVNEYNVAHPTAPVKP